VRVYFDENIISYKQLLDVFWKSHNPTTLNRQGPDIGTQYRSAIFYLDNNQKVEAEKSKQEMNKTTFNNSIVTEITKADEFYLAEEYHQKYLKKLGKY
jgi:peptide-methionine (S)-S-oxide reductase